MKTSHKLGLAALLLTTLASVVACNSDDNEGPSDGTGGTIISGSGGKKGSGGSDSGTGGEDGNTGGTDQGGAPNTGGTDTGTGGFIEPPNPDCNEEDDFNATDGCWDIHERPCNGTDNLHFFNQCTSRGFCGDEAFDDSQIQGWSGGKLPTPS